jgi:hypothetical protein
MPPDTQKMNNDMNDIAKMQMRTVRYITELMHGMPVDMDEVNSKISEKGFVDIVERAVDQAQNGVLPESKAYELMGEANVVLEEKLEGIAGNDIPTVEEMNKAREEGRRFSQPGDTTRYNPQSHQAAPSAAPPAQAPQQEMQPPQQTSQPQASAWTLPPHEQAQVDLMAIKSGQDVDLSVYADDAAPYR